MAHLAGVAPLIWNENLYCCFAGLPIQVYSGPCCASVWQALWQAVRAGINGANLRMTLHWRGAVLSWDYMSAIAISPHDTCYGLLHIGNRFMQEKFLFIGSHPIFICVFFRTELSFGWDAQLLPGLTHPASVELCVRLRVTCEMVTQLPTLVTKATAATCII